MCVVVGLPACHVVLPLSEPSISDSARPQTDVTPDLKQRPDLLPRECVTTLAGSGAGYRDGALIVARFSGPRDVAVGRGGEIYVADTGNNRIRAVSIEDGKVRTAAGSSAGYLDGAALQAQLNGPTGIAEHGGDLYVADTKNHRIRKLSAGEVSTVAGSGTGYEDGSIYTAMFKEPSGLAVDAWGTLYVADSGNGMVRRIVSGSVSRLVTFGTPVAVAVDAVGSVYAADSQSHKVLLVSPGTSTVAGSTEGFADGAAEAAKFSAPGGIALGAGGAIYVADRDNHRIRRVAAGSVSTVAGTGKPGAGDGLLDEASFNAPTGLAYDAIKQRLYIADTGNHRIRVITCGL
jgi:sugar lactone lactonase YvrE